MPPRFEFRPLAEDDLAMLHEWLNRPHVAEWWRGEVSVDEVREKYLPRIAEADLAHPFIALLDGEPAGYVQFYRCAEVPAWWPDDPGQGVLGIDQFLALGDRLDQGLGTAMVTSSSTCCCRSHRHPDPPRPPSGQRQGDPLLRESGVPPRRGDHDAGREALMMVLER